jgi:glycosyltransferase involved in cell wall biosynthesis
MSSIDVAIPNYNYGRYLRDCVGSILAQGIQSVRVLIMDNASSDNSVEVAQQLAAEDSRVALLARRVNVGLIGSLNEGLDWAASDYLVSLSADDLLPLGALKRALAVLETDESIVAAVGRCVFFDDGDAIPVPTGKVCLTPWQVMAGAAFIKNALTSHIVTLSPVLRTQIHKQAGYYRPGNGTDYEMWLRCACFGKVATSKAPQAIQRRHQSNISQANWRDPANRFRQQNDLIASFFAHEGAMLADGERIRRAGIQAVGKDAYWSAVSHLLRGERKTARQLFSLAFELCPRTTFLPPVDYLAKYTDVSHRVTKAVSGAASRRYFRRNPH